MGSSHSSSSSPASGNAMNQDINKKDYYVDQVDKYFDTLQDSIFNDESKIPNYQEFIIRFEWAPWLLLSGYKSKEVSTIDAMDRISTACYVFDRIYRYDETQQPSVKAKVIIYYGEDNYKNKSNGIPMYQEFSFSKNGKMMFIEGWSLDIGDHQLGKRDGEGWPIRPDRLSHAIVPLMDKETGEIDIHSVDVIGAMENQKCVRDLLESIERWKQSIAKEGAYFFCKQFVEAEVKCRTKEAVVIGSWITRNRLQGVSRIVSEDNSSSPSSPNSKQRGNGNKHSSSTLSSRKLRR